MNFTIVHLHNKLLSSLLTNASIPSHDGTSSSLQQRRKRQRPSVNDPDFDVDDTLIESKRRVEGWVMNLGKKERARVKKALAGAAEHGALGVAAAAEKDMWGGIGEKRWSPYTSSMSLFSMIKSNSAKEQIYQTHSSHHSHSLHATFPHPTNSPSASPNSPNYTTSPSP